MKTVNKLLTISTIPHWEYTCYFVPERKNMQAGKAKSFQIYFSFFFVSALDKCRSGYFPSNETGMEKALSGQLPLRL